MAGVGLWLTTWGIDPLSGGERYTFGSYQFYSGIKLIPFLIGIFAVSEVFDWGRTSDDADRFQRQQSENHHSRLATVKGFARHTGAVVRHRHDHWHHPG